MCASHGGEPAHVRVARRILRKGRFRESDLACGPHEPMDPRSARALAARGDRPRRIHNNCSGNHAGILLACRRLGLPGRGYERPEHPIEKRILAEIARVTGVARPDIGIAIDGCGLPVFSLPLSGLARAYAGLAAAQAGRDGTAGTSERRVWRAMCASPRMVAGRDRFTTELLGVGRGAWIGKEGADGVYAMAIRGTRERPPIGVAFKIEDGGGRARDAVAVAVLDELGVLRGEKARSLAPHRRPTVRNTRGDAVGEIVADVDLSDRRSALASASEGLRGSTIIAATAHGIRQPLVVSGSSRIARRAPADPRAGVPAARDRRDRRPRRSRCRAGRRSCSRTWGSDSAATAGLPWRSTSSRRERGCSPALGLSSFEE